MKIITEKNSKILILIGCILLVFGICLFFLSSKINFGDQIDTSKFAELGDYIGGIIGAIWSLAGVFLFYTALEEQRKDIKINQNALVQQIEAFKLQVTELEETRAVFKEQTETFKIQRFENTFFQLINLYNEIVGNTQLNIRGKTFEKRDVFKNSVIELMEQFRYYGTITKEDGYGGFITENNVKITNIEEAEIQINEVYKNFYYRSSNQIFSNYFRTVFHIFKFIHTSTLLTESDKTFYSSIIKAQLSSDELFLIFYNSLKQNLGYPKLLFLVNKYGILDNFDIGLVRQFPFHIEVFNNKSKMTNSVEI